MPCGVCHSILDSHTISFTRIDSFYMLEYRFLHIHNTAWIVSYSLTWFSHTQIYTDSSQLRSFRYSDKLWYLDLNLYIQALDELLGWISLVQIFAHKVQLYKKGQYRYLDTNNNLG